MDFLRRKNINLDITHRCPLECLRCQRWSSFTRHGKKVPGEDLSTENFYKIVNHFDHINFCGQVSDPVHHPKFIEFLRILNKHEKSTNIHHATGYKKMEWYIEAFKAHPNALWWFGIDGLPKDSHKYRVNQDGQKLFDVMVEAKKHLIKTPRWQYIIFNYNENDIQEAQDLADKVGIPLLLLHSGRWFGEDDPLKPKNEGYSLNRHGKIGYIDGKKVTGS